MDANPPRAEVTIYSPLFSPFRHPLTEGTISIGRASDCSIPIKDRSSLVFVEKGRAHA